MEVDDRECLRILSHGCESKATIGPPASSAEPEPRIRFTLTPHSLGSSMNTARRTHGFRESVIRGMTRLAREHQSINLAQGFPNFSAPELLKGGGGPRDPRQRQPVRHYLGCSAAPCRR